MALDITGTPMGGHGRKGVASAVRAGFCLISLAVVMKNVLLVPPETLNRDYVL